MSRTLKLAWRYVTYHKLKTVVLVLCITLTTFLPLALSRLLVQFNRQITARAAATPLVIGAKGSRFDLTLHALYFRHEAPGTIRLGEMENVRQGDLSEIIPIHARITTKTVIPVVGTNLAYFDFRGLTLKEGFGLTRLGDCVLGSQVAKRLNLTTGDSLLTDRDNLLDIAGRYPLKMRVAGVLRPTKTADDEVVFVDLKTAWVVEDLGHGHQDLAQEVDESKILGRSGDVTTASAAVLPYTEITEENVNSFHFHGDQNDFPVTALIVVPKDRKSETILLGRFESGDVGSQISQPALVVDELMSMVFQVQRFFAANALLIGVSTVLLLGLVITLSIRLRASEISTMFKLGCRRGTIASLITAELLIIFAVSGLLVTGMITIVNYTAADLVRNLLVG